MGCVKLHILDEQYQNTELRISYFNKELTSNNSDVNTCRILLYAYCLNNPVRFIDPTGKIVRPADEEALKMIQNTLTTDDMQYVRFDKNGNIDKDYLNSHTSESGNYGALSTMVNSDIVVNVSLGESITYMDNDGNMQTATMSYQAADAEFADLTGSTLGGTTTGEAGYMGQTLMPGTGKSGMNSPDNSVKVIVNKNLSAPARAELYSHEANGHALIYVQTGSRDKAAHQPPADGTWRETNIPLSNAIIKSKQETIKNMRSR